jgi:hypothetical protein
MNNPIVLPRNRWQLFSDEELQILRLALDRTARRMLASGSLADALREEIATERTRREQKQEAE